MKKSRNFGLNLTYSDWIPTLFRPNRGGEKLKDLTNFQFTSIPVRTIRTEHTINLDRTVQLVPVLSCFQEILCQPNYIYSSWMEYGFKSNRSNCVQCAVLIFLDGFLVFWFIFRIFLYRGVKKIVGRIPW
jgi:hypothetical protein